MAILAFAPAQMLDVTGPLDVFCVANQLAAAQGKPAPYELVLAAEEAGPVATMSGIDVVANRSFSGLRPDTVLLAGGIGARLAARSPEVMAQVRELCKRTPRVGSICTGAFALAGTGFLNGRRATTHWAHFEEFAQAFPDVAIDRDALFVTDGKFHSSAGISAGIDYALWLVEKDQGRAVALEVARSLVVFLKRPGGQSQFSTHLATDAAAGDTDEFYDLTQWMADNLRSELSVGNLADRVNMSPRNFARRFVEAMKVTPSRYVMLLRIDAARRMLTDGHAPVTRIADRCGFPSAESMRVAFQAHLGVTPSEFRQRFQTAAP